MIGIISGTNRPNSRTIQVANIYQNILKEFNQESIVIDLCRLPADFTVSALYDNNGKNEAYNSIINEIRACSKFVFIMPEYNGSFPGVLKAFIDGMDYPSGFRNKKTALVGISSGDLGASLALSHFTDVMHYLNAQVLAPKVRIVGIDKVLVNGTLETGKHHEYLTRQAKALIEF